MTLSNSDDAHNHLLERLLVVVLATVALQGVNILLLSATGLLGYNWISSVAILLSGLILASKTWLQGTSEGKRDFVFAWKSPWPWMVLGGLLVQIALYPPAMHDSLSYRLPRMFLALQAGRLDGFETTDWRMTAMPWGWEFLALPFANLNAIGWSRLINLAAWAISYQLLYSSALKACSDHARARLVALAFASAPAFLLQASSSANDLYAAALIVSSAWLVNRFREAPSTTPVMASLLALILAANAKPQFLVLGLAWAAWWAFGPDRPRRFTSWKVLLVAFPVFLFLSPLPLLVSNLSSSGALLGGEGAGSMAGKDASPVLMALAGSIQFLFAQCQLPLFPGAEAFSSAIREFPVFKTIHSSIPKFEPGVSLIPIVDGASFGLVHFVLILSGVFLAGRAGSVRVWQWAAACVGASLIAASQVVPGTIGRSFMGFVAVVLPMACVGIASIRNQRAIQLCCWLAIATGVATMATNPSSPLWPSHRLQNLVAEQGKTGLAAKLKQYNDYRERSQTGVGILSEVPEGETVGLLIRQVTPVAPLWYGNWSRNRLEYAHSTPPDEFQESGTRWLLVGENVDEQFPEIVDRFTRLPGWKPVASRSYRPYLSQGPETWTLFERSLKN